MAAARYFGAYRIEELIGRGGMGEVYRAVDTEHDREIALKVLPELLATNDEFRERFKRESRIAAKLTDPHVVPTHRYGEIDGRLYLEMPLIRGDNLAEVLSRDGALAPGRAVAIVEQIAGALDSAHERGLVHRDVKPSNVLITPSRHGLPEFAYLGDFGITRSIGAGTGAALTATGATVGTLEYMAPERFLGRTVDHRADVYALACVLYECLAGRCPFQSEELGVLMYAHLNQVPPKLLGTRPGRLPRMDRVIAVGMAKEPDRRYPTAGHLASAARAALEAPAGHPSPAVPPTAVAPPPTARPMIGVMPPGRTRPAWHGDGPQPTHGSPPPWGYSQPRPGAGVFRLRAPPGVPKTVQKSFIIWTILAALLVIPSILTLSGGATVVLGIAMLGLALAAAYGAAMMRAGKAWGRILTAVTGGILWLGLLLFLLGGLAALGVVAGEPAVVLAVAFLVIIAVGLGLIIAGYVYMFRAPVRAYLAASRQR